MVAPAAAAAHAEAVIALTAARFDVLPGRVPPACHFREVHRAGSQVMGTSPDHSALAALAGTGVPAAREVEGETFTCCFQ